MQVCKPVDDLIYKMQIIIITSSLKILILDLGNGSNLDKLQKMPVYTLTRLWLKQMKQICKPVDDLIFKKANHYSSVK